SNRSRLIALAESGISPKVDRVIELEPGLLECLGLRPLSQILCFRFELLKAARVTESLAWLSYPLVESRVQTAAVLTKEKDHVDAWCGRLCLAFVKERNPWNFRPVSLTDTRLHP